MTNWPAAIAVVMVFAVIAGCEVARDYNDTQQKIQQNDYQACLDSCPRPLNSEVTINCMEMCAVQHDVINKSEMKNG